MSMDPTAHRPPRTQASLSCTSPTPPSALTALEPRAPPQQVMPSHPNVTAVSRTLLEFTRSSPIDLAGSDTVHLLQPGSGSKTSVRGRAQWPFRSVFM